MVSEMTQDIPCILVVTRDRVGINGIVLEELIENVLVKKDSNVTNHTSLYKREHHNAITLFTSYFTHSSSQYPPVLVFDASEDPGRLTNNNNKGLLVKILEREMVDTASLFPNLRKHQPDGDTCTNHRLQVRKRVVILNIECAPMHVQKSIRVLVDKYMDRVQITFTTSSLSGVDAGLKSRAMVRPKMNIAGGINIYKPRKPSPQQETARSLARKLIACRTPKERGKVWIESAISTIGMLSSDTEESDGSISTNAEVIEMVAYIEHMCATVHRRNRTDERKVIEAGAALFVEYTNTLVQGN
jgi:hypothetical protein